MKYMVECLYAHGWDDACWAKSKGSNIEPWRFDIREEAQDEIDELCNNMGYDTADYRIMEV